MAQTFTKILIHFIWSTKGWAPLIDADVDAGLHGYMTGIAKNLQCWVMATNGTCDHVHMLVSMSKHVTVVEFMETVKRESSKWMKTQGRSEFAWQDGYAALTIGESGVGACKAYIAKQKVHHQKVGFREELIAWLRKYGVEYDERYIWS